MRLLLDTHVVLWQLSGERELSQSAGVRSLGLAAAHGLAVAQLPTHHRDPFDRLLIAQAMTEGLTLVTADPNFAAYDLPIVAA